MRMGGDSGVTGVILSVLFFPLMVSAQALPVLQPVPAPVLPANDPHFARPVQAINDADFLKASRAQAATVAAEQSGFGKLMSRIFSKRALAAGLRGTPQTMAVGLALDATLFWFLSEDELSPDAVVNQEFNENLRNRTWGELGLKKGLLNSSDLEVKLGENKKIELTTGYEVTKNGDIYLKTADGSTVFAGESAFQLKSIPSFPVRVVTPVDTEAFKFYPSPVYSMNNFSCASDVYISDSHSNRSDAEKYKFSNSQILGAYGSDFTSLSACVFYLRAKSFTPEVTSFSVVDYKSYGRIISSYPGSSEVKIAYKYLETYYDPDSGRDRKREKEAFSFLNIFLTDPFEERIAPQISSLIEHNKIQEPLAPSLAANMMNSALMRVASAADYQGIPFSTSSPVTAEEIQLAASEAAVPLTKGMLYQQIPQPASQPLVSFRPSPVLIENPDTFQQTNNLSEPYAQPASQHIGMTHPGTAAPSLDNPPDGKQILAPLLTLFPFIKNFTLPVRSAVCPVAEFEVVEKHYVMNSHCELLEKSRGLLALFSGIIRAFLSLRLILSA